MENRGKGSFSRSFKKEGADAVAKGDALPCSLEIVYGYCIQEEPEPNISSQKGNRFFKSWDLQLIVMRKWGLPQMEIHPHQVRMIASLQIFGGGKSWRTEIAWISPEKKRGKTYAAKLEVRCDEELLFEGEVRCPKTCFQGGKRERYKGFV